MPRVSVKTFGCKVNLCDSAALVERLRAAGADIVDPPQADAFLVNTCAVTAEALRKCAKHVRALRRHRPDAPAAVFGCAVTLGDFPAVEGARLFRPGEEDAAVAFLVRERETRNPPARTGRKRVEGEPEIPFSGRGSDLARLGRTRGFVKVADGCDGGCTYCIVPRLRGPARSRDPREILAETAALAGAGHREIVLTAIHLGRFGDDLRPPVRLGALVRSVAAVPGVERVRLSSVEALEIDGDILSLADLPAFAPHLHLPLQSGDAGVLAAMGRRYAPEDFLARVAAVREAFGAVAVTTDAIVGFPGEDEAAFGNTLAVCREAAISRIHAFPFSPRPGTVAATLPGRPPKAEIRARMDRLRALAGDLADAFRRGRIGSRDRVLVERLLPDRFGFAEGLDGVYQRVILPGGEEDIGALVPVRITGVEGEACAGERESSRKAEGPVSSKGVPGPFPEAE